MIKDKLKEKIAKLKKQEEATRVERQRLEAHLFEITAQNMKKKKHNEQPSTI